MAAGEDFDPGGKQSANMASYAEKLKTNVNYDQRLKRNVLEITLEKTEKDAEIILDDKCVARICQSLGMDIVSDVEGYQVYHNGRTSTISVWLYKGRNLDRFCKAESIKVSKGVITTMIRPAGRRDVTVSIHGLDFNTPDSFVIDYIKAFGGDVINRNVIYAKFTEGPFRGKYSGERKYQVDFSNCTRPLGTYHYLDGCRIKVFYRGNIRTCGRCHQSSVTCPGEGIASQCHDSGGPRVPLVDHMRKIWALIGFEPSKFTLPEDSIIEDEYDRPIHEGSHFSRNDGNNKLSEVNTTDEKCFTGLSVANFDASIEEDDIKKFLEKDIGMNLDDAKMDSIRDEKKATVTLSSNWSNIELKSVIKKLNFADCKTKFLGRPLYCRLLREITPEKVPLNSGQNNSDETPHSEGLNLNSTDIQRNPSSSSKKLEKKERQRQKKLQEQNQTVNAFDKMMKKPSSKDQLINATPTLKRGPLELSSPSSPDNNEPKKCRNGIALSQSK